MGTARCCCDCSTCRIFYDNFNREENTGTGSGSGLGSAWDELLGAWEIVDNVLRVTTDFSVAVVTDPTHATPYVWSASIKGDSFSDEIRIGMGLVGSTYLYAQIRLQAAAGLCGELALYNSAGTLLANVQVPSLTPSEWHVIKVCLNFAEPEDGEYGPEPYVGILAALVTTKSGARRRISIGDIPSTYDNPQVGVGTGNITNGVEFNDVCWQRMQTLADTVETTTGTGTGTGSGTGTFTTPAEPNCPTCLYRDGCDWGSLDVEIDGTIPCDWQEQSGTGTGTGGSWIGIYDRTVQTNANESILKFLTITPNSGTRQRMVAAVRGSAEGSQATLYVNFSDSSLNLAGRLTFSDTCGKLQILKDGVEVDFLNIEPLLLNEWHFLCVSYDGITLRADAAPMAEREHEAASLFYRHVAKAVIGSGDDTGTGTAADVGYYVAIGTGTNTGTVTFKEVVASFPYHPTLFPDCRTCDNCGLSKPAWYAVTNGGCEWGPISGTVTHEIDGYGNVRIDSVNGYAAYKGNDGSTNAFAEFSFKATVSGQKLRTYINDLGDLTGPWAEIEVNASPANSVLRISTGQTRNVTIRPNESSNMWICLDGTSLRANMGVNLAYIPPVVASVSGTLGAAAVGKYLVHQLRAVGGESRFGTTSFIRLRSDKPLAGDSPTTCRQCYAVCECCLNDISPKSLIAEVEGLGAIFGGCVVNMDDAWFLEGGECSWSWVPPCTGAVSFGVWCYDLCTLPGSLTVTISCGATTYSLAATLFHQPSYPSPGQTYLFAGGGSKPVDCTTLNRIPLLFTGFNNGFSFFPWNSTNFPGATRPVLYVSSA